MTIPFYAKSETNQGYIKNMEVVGYHDLNKMMAFQMALHKTEDGRYYLYCGSFCGAGWNILDVTDPANPRHVKFFECCDPEEYKAQCTPKIQVADGLMIAAIGGGVPFLHGTKPEDKAICGLQIYDLKEDPENPKLLSYWSTGTNGMGVHRFAYNGGKYVYMPAECPGFVGFIVRILDISDPVHPVECGRWWMPEQFKDGMLPGTYPEGHAAEKDWAMCHGCTLSPDCPDQMFMGYFAGKADLLTQRFIEIISQLPFLFVVMVVSDFVPLQLRGMLLILTLLAFFGWMHISYLVRTATMKEKTREYVEAARVMGAGPLHILARHIYPNLTGIIVTLLPFSIAAVVLSLASLDYMGFGLPDTYASWGRLLNDGLSKLSSPWVVSAAFCALVVTLMLVTFIGEAVREAVDPRRHTYYE